jgi:hypothetical protein
MQFNLHSSIDHLVVSCYFIEDGLNYVYEKLGVKPVLGGTHLKMGTHNQLLKLGESVYLEVIAINHDAIDPTRPRWFGMDKLKPGTKPKLVTWVVKTNNIQYASEKSKLQHGKIESMQRGNYNWQITIPTNGEMPMEGIAPTIIQWEGPLHPIHTLPDTNLSLERIEGFHFKANEINNSLAEIGFKGEFIAKTINQFETPYLTAFIKSPGGILKI